MTLSDQLVAAARTAGDEAALAGIEARKWEILTEWRPDRADIVAQHRLYSGVAATKAERAGKIAARADVPETTYSDGARAEIVAIHAAAAEAQELYDEKANNADVWGLTEEEALLERMRMGWNPQSRDPAPTVDTPAQLRANAMMGRAAVQALQEWLEAHPEADVTAPAAESTTPGT